MERLTERYGIASDGESDVWERGEIDGEINRKIWYCIRRRIRCLG